MEETAGELEKLRREGKILSIGVSNYDPGQMDAFRGSATLSVVQSPFFSGDDLRRSDPKFQPPRYQQYLAAAAALQRLAADRFGKSLLALAVRWILDQGPTIALWGARRPDQIAGLDAAFGWRLKTEDLEAIDGILAEHITDPVGPEFMAPPPNSPDSGVTKP